MSRAQGKVPGGRRKLRLGDLRSHQTLLARDLRNDAQFRTEWKKSVFGRAVALKVLQFRATKRLTQGQLATKLGMTQPAVARLELGEVTPSFNTLVRLAEGLNIEFVVDIKPRARRSKLVTQAAEREGAKTTTPAGSRLLVAVG